MSNNGELQRAQLQLTTDAQAERQPMKIQKRLASLPPPTGREGDGSGVTENSMTVIDDHMNAKLRV